MTRPGIKERFRSEAARYPVGWFNTQCTRPITWLLIRMQATPNQVTVLSFLASVVGIAVVPQDDWRLRLAGAGLIHLGLLLDHADGQVARARGMGTDWGMYLDWALDRVVETGAVLALGLAALRRPPHPTLVAWQPLGADGILALSILAIATVLTWRALMVYNDLLFLRSHVLTTGTVPDRGAAPQAAMRRPVVPWLLTRDWLFLFIVVGIALEQFQGALLVIALAHTVGSLEKAIVFRIRHRTPEGDAARVLWSDFH